MAKSKKSKKKKKTVEDPNSRMVCRNRKASHEYDLFDEYECGIVLQGSEVKSVRNNKVSLEEAYARINNSEAFLVGAEIAEYPQATVMNHEPKRTRKLLLHKREIRKLETAVQQGGFTLVPLFVSFRDGRIKVTIAVAKGRKLYDKREKLKEKDATRAMDRAKRRSL